jgi:hypothetical protein
MMLLNEWQYQQYTNLLAVIKDVHGQRADDLCWMDIDRIFTAAGLPVPDRSVGDKDAMLKNCERFVRDHCVGKVSWRSYAELEAENRRLRVAGATLLDEWRCGEEAMIYERGGRSELKELEREYAERKQFWEGKGDADHTQGEAEPAAD